VRPALFSRAVFLLAVLAVTQGNAAAQFRDNSTMGQFYRLEPPLTAQRYFDAVRIERVSPLSIAMPPPVEPVPLRVALSALTGQILELPGRQRIYFTAVNAAGFLSLFEVDLLTREARQVLPQPDVGMPYAVDMLVAPDASKLYVQWFAPGFPPRTDIYDGQTLRWLGRTSEFRPDQRAAGFEHRPPYMWTLDPANRAVLVDTGRDRVARVFDYQRWFGPVYGVIADAWRDLLLVRLEVGHDRYHVVDVVSGEIGPPLDLADNRAAHPRLVLGGRALVLIDMERRPYRRDRSWSETAIATGSGAIYDLRAGPLLGEFRLALPYEFPVSAVGTNADPSVPGRLWVHVPGDDERFDLGRPACDRKSPRGDELTAQIEARWDAASDDPLRYGYSVEVVASSEIAAGALAIEIGRETERTGAPDGWGVDLIKRDRWIRWTNGLGPADEDIAPGTAKVGFVVAGKADTRPGIAEYRIQAAIGLPRGCESDDRFLKNSVKGYTIGPVTVDTAIPRKLAQRLERLVQEACDIGWVEKGDCATLRSAASAVESTDTDRTAAVDRFLQALADASLRNSAVMVLTDAALAVKGAIGRSR